MASKQGDRWLFTSTRGRILLLIRRASRTVDELAQMLDLTDNAVRAHLATLERDGLVQRRGVRRGGGKPAYVYEMTADAELLFPKAHSLVLSQLLEVLSEHLDNSALEQILRATGRRLAHTPANSRNSLHERLNAAVALLNDMGGLVELEENEGVFTICGYSCPLPSLVPGHPELCQLTESLLTEMVGTPVHERCDRSAVLQCRFEVAKG